MRGKQHLAQRFDQHFLAQRVGLQLRARLNRARQVHRNQFLIGHVADQ